MKNNTSKERNFYTQGQQRIARILLAAWLLAIGSPEGILAAPEHEKAIVPAATTSPGDPSLASAPSTPTPEDQLPVESSELDEAGSSNQQSVVDPSNAVAISRPATPSVLQETGSSSQQLAVESSDAVDTSRPATPTLEELMSQSDAPKIDILVAALKAAPSQEQCPWIEAAIHWFADQKSEILSLKPGAIQDYAALAHVRVDDDKGNREHLERYFYSLCTKIKDKSFREESFIQALTAVLAHLDPDVFDKNIFSLTQLADCLLAKLKRSENAFTQNTYPNDRITLEALFQTLFLAQKIDPSPLDQTEGSLYQNFSNQLTDLAKVQYYPVKYHAQLLKQTLELLAKIEDPSTRQQVWKGCQAVFRFLEAGIYCYQGVSNPLTPLIEASDGARMTLKIWNKGILNLKPGNFESAYKAFKQGYDFIREIRKEQHKKAQKSWYDRLFQIYAESFEILQKDAVDFASLAELLENFEQEQKKIRNSEDLKALRFGIAMQLQTLALQGPTPEVRNGAIERLMALVQPEAWGAGEDILVCLLNSLAVVAAQSQSASEAVVGSAVASESHADLARAAEAAMGRVALEALAEKADKLESALAQQPGKGRWRLPQRPSTPEAAASKTFRKWLGGDGKRLADKLKDFQDQLASEQNTSGQGDMFRYVRGRLPMTATSARQALKAHYQKCFSEVPSFFPEDPKTPMSEIQCHLMLLEQVKVKESLPAGNENQLMAIHERIEWQKRPIALCDLFNHRSVKPDGPIEEISKVLLIGEAGTGKTTLSHKIVHDWAQGHWGADFTALYLLPVRNLRKDQYNKSTFRTEPTLATAIVRECFPAECRKEDQDFKRLRDQVQEELKHSTTLVILDGLDERAGAHEDILNEAERGVHKLLMLSRPYGVAHERQKATIELEHEGFDDRQLDTYVQGYFEKRSQELAEPAATLSEELLRFIKEYPAPKAISHVPVNLAILCALWRTDPLGVRSATLQGSLPGLYRALTTYLWKRYETNQSAIKTRAASQEELFRKLGEIALWAFNQGTIQLHAMTVREFLSELPSAREGMLEASGLLKALGSSQYEFPHLTFQEYFAGCTLARQFLSDNSREHQRAKKFLSRHRYAPQYGRTLSFMAGEVSRSEGVEGIQNLLALLGPGNQAGVALQHLLLQLRVVHEWLCMARSEIEEDMEMLEREFGMLSLLKEWFVKGLKQVGREGYGPSSPGGRLLGLLTDSLQVFRSVLRHAPGVLDLLQQYAKYTEKDVLGGYPVRAAAVETLGQVISVVPGDSGAILSTLRAAAKDEYKDWRGSYPVREAAFRSLGQVISVVPGESDAILSTLHEAAKDENYSVRKSAVEALGQVISVVPGESVTILATLRAAAKDEDKDWRDSCPVCEAAFRSLGQALSAVPGESDAILSTLHEAAKDWDYHVRKPAVAALGQALSVVPEESGAILSTLRAAAKDKNDNVRVASVAALGQALSVVPGDSGAILATLHEAAQDEYKYPWNDTYPVREAANKFLAPSMDSVGASNLSVWQGNPQRFTGLLKTEATQIEQTLHTYKLGKAIWEQYYGSVGEEPALPAGIDIEAMMNSACPFCPGNKLKETHLLVLIPSHVAGRPLTLNYLGELIKSPQGEGHGTQYRGYWSKAREAIGRQSPGRSYWVLMTRGVLPGSRAKRYENQCALVAGHANRTGLPYAVPGALEAAVAMLLHHVRSGERLYGDNPYMYTRCRERVDNYQLVVGCFSSGGLYVDYSSYDSIRTYGVSALRKF